MKRLLVIVAILCLTGCQTMTTKPLKGGGAVVTGRSLQAPASVSIAQPDNPKGTSKQETSEQETATYVFPQPTTVVTEVKAPDGTSTVVTEHIPAGTRKITNSTRDVKQTLGAAQEDTSREISAKLASFKPVQFVGIAMLLAAAAMFHPLVRGAIGGGKEVQMATAGIGVVLIFGPALFVGNERLILLGGIAALLVTYGLSRLAYYKGKNDSTPPSNV